MMPTINKVNDKVCAKIICIVANKKIMYKNNKMYFIPKEVRFGESKYGFRKAYGNKFDMMSCVKFQKKYPYQFRLVNLYCYVQKIRKQTYMKNVSFVVGTKKTKKSADAEADRLSVDDIDKYNAKLGVIIIYNKSKTKTLLYDVFVNSGTVAHEDEHCNSIFLKDDRKHDYYVKGRFVNKMYYQNTREKQAIKADIDYSNFLVDLFIRHAWLVGCLNYIQKDAYCLDCKLKKYNTVKLNVVKK